MIKKGEDCTLGVVCDVIEKKTTFGMELIMQILQKTEHDKGKNIDRHLVPVTGMYFFKF